MKVALYTRVSTDEQAKEGYSLEVQREYEELIKIKFFFARYSYEPKEISKSRQRYE